MADHHSHSMAGLSGHYDETDEHHVLKVFVWWSYVLGKIIDGWGNAAGPIMQGNSRSLVMRYVLYWPWGLCCRCMDVSRSGKLGGYGVNCRRWPSFFCQCRNLVTIPIYFRTAESEVGPLRPTPYIPQLGRTHTFESFTTSFIHAPDKAEKS